MGKTKNVIVSGEVEMKVYLHVINLKTDSVSVDEYGNIFIEDPDKFFDDWIEEWNAGEGELLGVCDERVNLEKEEYDWDDDDIDEDDDDIDE